MKSWRAVLVALALLAPLLGTLVATQVHFPTLAGFWQGLLIQLALLLAPLELACSRRGLQDIGLSLQGSRRSIAVGLSLSAVYLGLLGLATLLGAHTSHFDVSRRMLGTIPVLLLYIPFWGVLEGIWIAYLLATTQRLLRRTASDWLTIGLAALWFGLLHSVIQFFFYHTALLTSLGYLVVGLLVVVAGLIQKYTKNGWGFVLFWVVSNF